MSLNLDTSNSNVISNNTINEEENENDDDISMKDDNASVNNDADYNQQSNFDTSILENSEIISSYNGTSSISPDTEASQIKFPEEYNIKFYLVCKLFDKVGSLKPKEKFKLVIKFIDTYFKKAIDNKVNIYPFLRLVFPRLDRFRATYGVQESFIGKLYSDILGLPQSEKDMLKHWKNPNYVKAPAPCGDFIGLIGFVVAKRVTDKSTITINEVNEFLENLSHGKSKDEKGKILTKMIRKCTATEQKWIIGIIIRDLKLSLSHESFFKFYDRRLLEIYNTTSSLIEVCNYLTNPKDPKYSKSFYQIFSPLRPMLVARMTLNNIYSNFADTEVMVETKWDGERIQCHLNEGEVKWFSRHGIDYTYLYGPKLSHLIKTSVNAKRAILDGEIVVYDKINKKFAPFGENKTIALAQNENDKCLCYEIFDVIYLCSPGGNSYSLNDIILSDRKKILQKIVTPIPKKIEIVIGKETNSIDGIMEEFNKALQRSEEGIVIKKRDSKYKPDERSSDWVKMKCDYIDTIVDTLDCIIIGGYYGNGKRVGEEQANYNNFYKNLNSGALNNNNNLNPNSVSEASSDSLATFLVGVMKKCDKENPRASTILPLVKVGTGYTLQDLTQIRNKLRTKWKKYDSRYPPSLFGQWVPGVSEKPDVIIDDPSESIIIEVKAAEIVPTENFPAKVTLRFPRVVKLRWDKSWTDTLDFKELLKFYNISTNNINANNATYGTGLQHQHIIKKNKRKDLLETIENGMEDINVDFKKKRRADKYSKILENFRDTDTSNITKISNLFDKCQFLVLCLDDVVSENSIKKKMLEYSIVENGGTKVQNYLNSVTYVIAEKIDLKIKNILSHKDINIINSKWVYDCIKFQRIIPFTPLYLIHINEETKKNFSMNIDKYNDSFFTDIDQNSIKNIFDGMKNIDVDKYYEKACKILGEEFGEDFENIINNC